MTETIESPTVAIPAATIIGNAAYLVKNFERTDGGWIAYKIFNSVYTSPERWKIEADSILTEPDLETNPAYDCAQGINIAKSIGWIEDFISDTSSDRDGNMVAIVWKVFIPDTAIIVIPHGSDGKIRTNQIQLLEVIGTAEYGTSDDPDDFYDDYDYEEEDYYEDDDF